jgi:hypothetical protein
MNREPPRYAFSNFNEYRHTISVGYIPPRVIVLTVPLFKVEAAPFAIWPDIWKHE